MSLQQFKMYQKDLLPALAFELTDLKGVAINLSTVLSVKLYIGTIGSTLIVDGEDLIITDAANGKCKYEWKLPETDVAGTFEAQIVIRFASTKPQTAGKFELLIEESLY